MKEILINVSKETRMVDLNKSVIGNDGENLQGKLIFTFIDEFVNGQARLEYEIKGNKNYVVLDKENNTYTIPVKNVITKEGQIDMQLVITEETDEEGIPVFKSNKFYLFCNSSINAVNEAPNGYELWIDQANAKLNEFDKAIDVIKVDGAGNKYLSDDGTYKLVSGGSGTGGTSNYKDLEEKPSINNVELVGNKTLDALGIQPKGNYQDKLVSGTNIKTINNQSILGNGNINIQGGSGSYTLPIASADTLGGIKVGENLSIDENGVLSASGGGSETVEEVDIPTNGEIVKAGFKVDGKDVYVKRYTGQTASTSHFFDRELDTSKYSIVKFEGTIYTKSPAGNPAFMYQLPVFGSGANDFAYVSAIASNVGASNYGIRVLCGVDRVGQYYDINAYFYEN